MDLGIEQRIVTAQRVKKSSQTNVVLSESLGNCEAQEECQDLHTFVLTTLLEIFQPL